MITSYHHVELNGVKYRLAESAEGEHYMENAEPLRPPNAQVIQGANNTFQMRPDTLAWLIDSWAGGAGQLRYDTENPGRMRELFNVDGFTKPGAVRKGFYVTEFVIDTPTTLPDIEYWFRGFVRRQNYVFAVVDDYSGTTESAMFRWSQTSEWWEDVTLGTPATNRPKSRAVFNPADSNNNPLTLASSGQYIFEGDDFNVWANNANISASASHPGVLGDYLYWMDQDGIKEYLATSSPGTTAPDTVWTPTTAPGTLTNLTFGDNRAYFAVRAGDVSIIYELVPTTAVGRATVSSIATLEGVMARSVKYASGILFIATETGAIYYVRPGAEYGLLKSAEEAEVADRNIYDPLVTSENFLYAIPRKTSNAFDTFDDPQQLLAVDRVSGAYEIAAYWEERYPFSLLGATNLPDDSGGTPTTERIWASRDQGSGGGKFIDASRADVTYDGHFLTPWHNFNVAENKQLMSITVQHDMHADWQFKVYALKDGGTTETLIGTVTGAGGPAVTTLIPSSGFEFSQLSLKGEFTGTGSAANVPYVYSVEAKATVVQTQKLWQLLLDCANDATGVHDGTNGPAKLANIRTLGDLAGPFTFKDGYKDPRTGEFNTHTVVMDSFQIRQDRPGEGVAAVVIREVS